MKELRKYLLVGAGLLCLFVSCGKKAEGAKSDLSRSVVFCADSAYSYIEKQMSFGPRVPNSSAHMQCAVWLTEQLRAYGAEVEIQKGVLPDYRGHDQQIFNIIGHFSTPKIADRPRLLLCAHYDTRPWCDEEPISADRYYNVPGANDGASGVGVLLEVARQLKQKMADSTLRTPVDIIFLDMEDSGTPSFYTGIERSDTWCLGSQLWASHYINTQEQTGLSYQFGVLLDMIGDPNAVFLLEGYSTAFARDFQNEIWDNAQKLGYSSIFSRRKGNYILDDHYYINSVAGIPCVDIIHCDSRNHTGFPRWWHTRQDDMQNISPKTLQTVGEVVMSLL